MLHNGLNETDDLAFYYRIAAWLTKDDSEAACIIRPFPGHLTRYPFAGEFGETALDSYLSDAGDLFRQFLKYAVESQWLLSVLSGPRDEPSFVGGRLLTDDGKFGGSAVADAIHADFAEIFKANGSYGENVSRTAIGNCVKALRDGLQWKRATAERRPDELGGLYAPAIHSIGYSLGGFVAQSLLFAWPGSITSCASVFSGGPLRNLQPTAFAHPEEWQTVLHALRYEIEDAMMSGRLKLEGKRVAGIAHLDFGYFKRLFYEIFVQDFSAAYRTRLSEYNSRIMFVVGGDDDIVRPFSVQQAGPREGVNMVEIAKLGHFVESTRDPEEVDRRQFWLPEVFRLVRAFAKDAEITHARDLRPEAQDLTAAQQRHGVSRVAADPNKFTSPDFELKLNNLIEMIGSADASGARGWLLVAQNDVPPVFLGPTASARRALALHHSEDHVRRHRNGAQWRFEQLLEAQASVSLVVPEKLKEWFVRGTISFSSNSETPGGRSFAPNERKPLWREFVKRWGTSGALRFFTASKVNEGALLTFAEGEIAAVRKTLSDLAEPLYVSTLPDVWVGLSPTALRGWCGPGTEGRDRQTVESELALRALRLHYGSTSERAEARGQLTQFLRDGHLQVVRVSGSRFNPRFRGELISDERRAERLFTHWALAWLMSQPAR